MNPSEDRTTGVPARPLVIIPTYNERANVVQLLPAIIGGDSRLHVLIVDDSSPDGTAGAVLEMTRNGAPPRIFLEQRPGNPPQ